MSGLGLWPIGARPLAALPRRSGNVQAFAVLAIAGTGAFSAVMTAPARMSVTSAGNGATSFVSDNGKGVLTSAGVGALNITRSVLAFSSLQSAGLGNLTVQPAVIARSTMSAGGNGAFAPVMRASVSSSTTMQGSSTFGGSDAPGSVIQFTGFGIFTAVGYAFFDDAEKAGPAFEQRTAWVPYEDRHPVSADAYVPAEPRTAYVPAENTVAVAPYEDRVYYVSSKAEPPGPPNRRRIL